MSVSVEPVKIDENTTVYFELDDDSIEEYRRVSLSGEAAQQEFKKALEHIKPATDELLSTLTNLIERPKEISVEFGIKVSGSLGAIIAKSSAEANFKVALKWTA